MVGRLLPLAVVLALSPLPIVAVVLTLLAPKAGGAGAGFLLGWTTGIAGVTTAALVLTGGAARNSARLALVAAYLELGLGVLLLVLAVRQWRSRVDDGGTAVLPAWLAAFDRITVVRAGGLGLLLSAANPKAALVCVGAGLALAGSALTGVQAAVSVALFTGVAASTVGLLVLASAVGGAPIAGALRSLRRWLTTHGAVAAGCLLAVIGGVLVVQGATGLV